MGKRGPKPKGKVALVWSPEFAYAIGLIVSDGNLSPDGRHISLSSKDDEMIQNYLLALAIKVPVTKKSSGYKADKKYFSVQFGDVLFYNFLVSIGLMANKSKIIGKIKISKEYFFDFLRGSFDGDGCTHSYFDTRWKSSFMFYTIFTSASLEHITWLRLEISNYLAIVGHVTKSKNNVYQLKYAKNESLVLLKALYHNKKVICLSRKRLKVEAMLRIIGQRL